MQSAINQQISLSGDAEVSAKLAAVGEAGEQTAQHLVTAGNRATSALQQLTERLTPLRNAFSQLRASLGLGGGTDGGVFGALKTAAEGLGGSIGVAGAAIVAAAGGVALLAEKSAEAAEAINHTAIAVGSSVENIQKMNFAFSQSGSNAEVFQRAAAAILNAADQGGAAADKFLKLGVALRDGFGRVRDPVLVMQDIAKALDRLPDPANRAAEVIGLFGRRFGSELVPVLAQGSQHLADLGAEASRLGVVLGAGPIEAGTKLAESMRKLGDVLAATRNAFGLVFAPSMTRAVDALAEGFAAAREPLLAVARALDTIGSQLGGELVKAAHAFGTAIGGIGAALTALMNSTFVQDFIPFFQQAGATISGVFKYISDAFTELQDRLGTNFNAGAFLAFAATLRGIVPAFAALRIGIGLVTRLFSPFLIVMTVAAAAGEALDRALGTNGLATALPAVAAGIGLLRSAFVSLNAVLLVNPFVAFGAALAGVVATLFLLVGDTKGLSDIIGKVFGADAANSFDNFVKNFRSAMVPLLEWFEHTWLARFLTDMAHAIDEVSKLLQALGLVKPQALAAGASAGSSSQGIDPSGINWSSLQTKAAGGSIAGPGGTDRVPILATAGEFVMRLDAVRHYGVNLMQRINSLSLPRFELGGMVDNFSEMLAPWPAFAAGGLVDNFSEMLAPWPAFAAGGLVGSLGSGPSTGTRDHVVVELRMGGHSFEMLAPRTVAEKLVDHARGEQMRSAGRRPSRDSGTTNG